MPDTEFIERVQSLASGPPLVCLQVSGPSPRNGAPSLRVCVVYETSNSSSTPSLRVVGVWEGEYFTGTQAVHHALFGRDVSRVTDDHHEGVAAEIAASVAHLPTFTLRTVREVKGFARTARQLKEAHDA